MKNCVTINQKKEELIIKISEDAKQNEIMENLKSKMPKLKQLYKEEKTPITVTGKILKNKEIEEIQELIKKYVDVKINFDSPKVLGLHGIKKTFETEIKTSETKYYKGSLRSGQKLEYEGSIVIIGDVNGGAEVVAGENIIVLGALRGLAHAGAKGNKKAIIASLTLEAPQIRIANVLKEMPLTDENIYERPYIFVDKDEIIIE